MLEFLSASFEVGPHGGRQTRYGCYIINFILYHHTTTYPHINSKTNKSTIFKECDKGIERYTNRGEREGME